MCAAHQLKDPDGGEATASDDSPSAAADAALVDALRRYKYVAPELSFLERRVLDNLWTSVVESCFPRWLAPNVVTLCGGACIACAVALTLTHSPLLEGASPSWVYVANALLIFLYQTFDGCDGKQARRTASGSPLGELMDHGVDAVVVGGIVALTTETFGLGLSSPWAWIILVGAQASFHASNLTLVLGGRMLVHDSDATELQWAIIGVHLASAAFGPSAWATPVGFGLPVYDASWPLDWERGVPLRELVVLTAVGCMVVNLSSWFRNLAASVRATPAGVPQNAAARTVLRQAAMMAAFGVATAWCYLSVVGRQQPAGGAGAAGDGGGDDGGAGQRQRLVLLLLCSCFCFGEAMAR